MTFFTFFKIELVWDYHTDLSCLNIYVLMILKERKYELMSQNIDWA